MTDLNAGDNQGLACTGYHIHARPVGGTIGALLDLQQALAQISPVALDIVPASTLYLCVATLVTAQQSSTVACRQWVRIRRAIDSELAGLLGRKDALSIVFDRVDIAGPDIIVSSDSESSFLIDVRGRFSDLIATLGYVAPLHNSMHMRIAQFRTGFVDTDAIRSLERSGLELDVHFDVLRPVREYRVPSLAFEEIEFSG